MPIYDISLTLSNDLPVWPGDTPISLVRNSDMQRVDLDTLIGPCQVIHLPHVDSIDAVALAQANLPVNTRRVLIRTRNSEYWARGDNTFHTDFVAIEPSGADWIVRHDIQLVGVDYLSVGAFEGGIRTHEILLSHGVVPVEGLD